MRILFLSIEFSIGTFSGNGIYAISQVRALRGLGHEVLVICGRPAALSPPTADTDASLFSVPLPVWNRLDVGCSWKEYALGCGAPSIVNAVVNFEADVVLGVDWHSYQAYLNVHEALVADFYYQKSASSSFPLKINIPPYVCSNYRVYLRSLSPNDTDFQIMKKLEGDSLLHGICSTVLSASDQNFVEKNYYISDHLPPPLHVILPALRADLAAIPLPHITQERKYLLCCVRASSEKEPHRFINLICELEKRNFFNKNGIIPLLAGAGWKVTSSSVGAYSPDQEQQQEPLKTTSTTSLTPTEKYVLELREQIKTYVPCCQVIEHFLGPIEMAQIYFQTVLNVHPPLYDAFGMTCCEAASQMAPSLVAGKGHIGATDLLSEEREEIFVTDMEDSIENLADTVEKIIQNREKLKKVGETAAAAVRKWSEKANAAAVIRVLIDSLDSYSNSSSSRNALEVQSQEASKKTPTEPVLPSACPFYTLPRRGGVDVLVPHTRTSNSTNKVQADKLMYKYFEENYLATNTPVIFSGIATKWLVTKDFFDSSTGSIDIENLERKFGGSSVVATDTAFRHRGEGPCKEMSVAEYCHWWREHHRTGNRDGDNDLEKKVDQEKLEVEHVWYLKDWHFVKDASLGSKHEEKEDSKDFRYYQIPTYFSDDWLNEWYDHLACTTAFNGIETEDNITPATTTTTTTTTRTRKTSSSTSDYRFVYLGPRGSSTPLHTDVLHSHSWSANIAGRKLWRVLPAEYAHLVQDKTTGMSHPYDFYPSDIQEGRNERVVVLRDSNGTICLENPRTGEHSTTKNTAKNSNRQYSTIATPFPDINTRFPGLQQAQHHILEIIGYPGEAIFIPSGWYHTVLNLDDCLSINHNWISTHSVMSSWRYLRKERTRAENLIEDCRELNGVAEFEKLVQRNVEMNAGLGFSRFGAMVRYIAEKAAGKNGKEEEELDFDRLTAAGRVLSELLEEQEKVFLLDPGDRRNDTGSEMEEEKEEEKNAREALESDIRLNKKCLELISVKTL